MPINLELVLSSTSTLLSSSRLSEAPDITDQIIVARLRAWNGDERSIKSFPMKTFRPQQPKRQANPPEASPSSSEPNDPVIAQDHKET